MLVNLLSHIWCPRASRAVWASKIILGSETRQQEPIDNRWTSRGASRYYQAGRELIFEYPKTWSPPPLRVMKNDIRTRKIGQPHFQLAQTFTFTFVSVGCELWAGSLCLRCSNEKCLCKLKIEKFSEIFMTEGSSRLIGFAKQESAECCEPSGKHDRPRRNLTVNNIWFGAAGCEKDYHCWRSSNNSRECGEARWWERAS